MALSTAEKAFLEITAAVGGGLWVREARAKKRKIVKGTGVPACLEGVWANRAGLIPEIFNELNPNAQATADQFYGFNLTADAQGKIFMGLAMIYAEKIETPVMVAAQAALGQIAACDWAAQQWPLTQAEALASAEAMALVVLADIQDVVMPFEQPPVKVVPDTDFMKGCMAETWKPQGGPLIQDIGGALSPAAVEVAQGHAFHLTEAAQGAALLLLATMAANDPDVWTTTPILSTLQTVAPQCDWITKDHYGSSMADAWADVDRMYAIVAADIGI